MAINSYDIGNGVELFGNYFDKDGVTPRDPTAAFCKVMDPTGLETTYTGGQLTHPTTGQYTLDIIPNKPGTWLYRWEGTGAVVATGDSYFIINDSALK